MLEISLPCFKYSVKSGGAWIWRDKDPAKPADPEKIREAVRAMGFQA